MYVDPEKLEVKGEIPFSSEFDAELGPRGAATRVWCRSTSLPTPARRRPRRAGAFYVRPAGERGRTYYFEDPAGDEALVITIYYYYY